MQPNFDALYRALVTYTTDPTNTGKIRVQCPQVAGSAEIRSAEPANPLMPVPKLGSTVWLGFNGGDTTKPFYFTNLSYIMLGTDGTTVQASSLTSPSRADATQILLVSGNDNTPTGNVNVPHVSMRDVNGDSALDLRISGSLLKTSNTGAVATWHAPSLGTGWATGPSSGTVQAIQYRLDAFDNLVIVGALHSTSATPASTLFVIPSTGGFRPVITQREGIISNAGAVITQRMVEVNSNGSVTLTPAITVTATDVYFNVTVPLGNIS